MPTRCLVIADSGDCGGHERARTSGLAASLRAIGRPPAGRVKHPTDSKIHQKPGCFLHILHDCRTACRQASIAPCRENRHRNVMARRRRLVRFIAALR